MAADGRWYTREEFDDLHDVGGRLAYDGQVLGTDLDDAWEVADGNLVQAFFHPHVVSLPWGGTSRAVSFRIRARWQPNPPPLSPLPEPEPATPSSPPVPPPPPPLQSPPASLPFDQRQAAAIFIQRGWRSVQQPRRETALQFQLQQAVAVAIQNAWRVTIIRRRLLVAHTAASTLQRFWRAGAVARVKRAAERDKECELEIAIRLSKLEIDWPDHRRQDLQTAITQSRQSEPDAYHEIARLQGAIRRSLDDHKAKEYSEKSYVDGMLESELRLALHRSLQDNDDSD